ncbi:right-handed parallel beta-helix repeat-containing protein [Gaetbulibacter sp. M240]|uniref:hypothetical protein n=1 Tax=Gaetbulibacter sp. M240 TaxID=3126511 RepID=UPI00374E2C34
MKRRILIASILLSIFSLNVACSNEPLTEDPAAISTEPTQKEPILINGETPCDFTLNNLDPNSTVIIDCLIDLQGQTINIPAGVTLEHQSGGDIINGALNFSEGSIISGELLNASLELSGNTAQLKSPNFNFIPERWEIVQGVVSDDLALGNRHIINKAISMTKSMGMTVFQIDKLDAYFDCQLYWVNAKEQAENAIRVPSNTELKMSNNTYLRVQPSNAPAYTLLAIYDVVNVKITGGNLYGDRWDHDYSPVNDRNGNNRDGHEWGFVIQVSGGKNVTIDGVNIQDATGDGFIVNSTNIRNENGEPGNTVISENVILKNSIVNKSRRNGIGIVDGDGILIENSEITNTGLGENPSGVNYSSAGTWPKYGVDLEAWRVREADGTLKEYERVENVTFRGNSFSNNKAGDIDLYTCSFITIENNTFDGMIANIAAHDIIIKNNIFQARVLADGTSFQNAILLKSNVNQWDGEFTKNYIISGNTIKGYQNGILVSGENFNIFNNEINDCKNSFVFGGLKNSVSHDNIINSGVSDSFGYYSRGGAANNFKIYNEKITVMRRALNLYDLTIDPSQLLEFDNCEFISIDNTNNEINNCKNILIKNSAFNRETNIINSTNIIFENVQLN